MLCPKCGSQNNNDALICSNCGQVFFLNGFQEQDLETPPMKTSADNKEGCFGKIYKFFSICGTVIAIILVLWSCTLDKEDYLNLIQEYIPVYSMTIQNEVASQYNTSLTYGEAFDRYFKECNWSDQTRNSEPIVKFTGIFDNGNGTYSKVQIIFAITPLEDLGEFYYQIDTVIIDGIDIGWLGINVLMSNIFSSVGV